jgi:hypothetical protein
LWVTWALSSTVAAAVGGAAIDAAGAAGVVIFGTAGATAQWLVLRPARLGSAAWVYSTAAGNVAAWLAATVGGALGYGLGGLVIGWPAGWATDRLGAPLSPAASLFLTYRAAGVVGGATGGLIIAACQWRLVSAYAGRRAADGWLAATSAAGAAAGAVAGVDLVFRVFTYYARQPVLGIEFLFPNALLAGVVFGAISGVALIRPLRARWPDG